MPIILPQPFMVIPPDGSDPVHIHENPPLPPGQPVVGVTLVTPYVAQRWLHAGEPVPHAVVMRDQEHTIYVGESIVQMAAAGPEKATAAMVVEMGCPQAETAWTAVVAMRQAFELPESRDVDGLILDADTGQVLGGGSMIYDLRKPTVFVVLLVDPKSNPGGRMN